MLALGRDGWCGTTSGRCKFDPRSYSSLSSKIPVNCEENYPPYFTCFGQGHSQTSLILHFCLSFTPRMSASTSMRLLLRCPHLLISVLNPVAALSNGMFEELNPWSAPFLHHHFPDITHFKLWNFTEQLDSVPELKVKFKNSRGHKFEVPKLKHSDLATEGTAPLVQLSRREDIRHCGQIAHCKVHIMSLVWKSVS